MATDGGFQDFGSAQKGKSSGTAKAGVPYWGAEPDTYDTVTIAGFRLPGLCSLKGKGYEMRAKHHKPAGQSGTSTVYLANEPAEFEVTVMMTTEAHLRDFEKLVPLFKPPAKPKKKAASVADPSFRLDFPLLPVGSTGFGALDANGGLGLGQFGPTSYPGVRTDPGEASTYNPQAAAAAAAAKSSADDGAPKYVSISHPLLALFRITHCRIIKVTLPEQLEDKGMWQVHIDCQEHVLAGKKDAAVGITGSAGDIAGMANAYSNITKGPLARQASAPSATSAGPPSRGVTEGF